MSSNESLQQLHEFKKLYPKKFAPEEAVFSRIHPGGKIFIGTGCGEPQYLVKALINYVENHPGAFYDAEIFQVLTLGVAPYTDEKFKRNFRHNSFFIGNHTRAAINQGLADYTPIFLSQVPELFHRMLVPIDVVLVQVSMPNEEGYFSLGVSVDITKSAIENAHLVVAQINREMPFVYGDGLVHINEIDFLIHHDEPILEYANQAPTDIAEKIGEHVARIIDNGDTIQVGYGSIPNAVISNLKDKAHLGVHTELLTDGIVDLIKAGVIDNSKKTTDPNLTVAAFCMGKKATYEYIHKNPNIQFRSIQYTNSPLTIANHKHMIAINSALEIDLTGQATAESLGKTFYSGIGGQADFMRGAVLSEGGTSILALQSTSDNGQVSRIVPYISEGAGVTLTRGDIHYVVTEFGIAYLHGKNIRERALDLIAIAHPKFRPWLLEKAKELELVYQDQVLLPGDHGEYPERLEIYRTTDTGLKLLLRPVKISDEPLLKDLFYSLSDESRYRRFITYRKDMPHERLQGFLVIDYQREMEILAVVDHKGQEELVGIGQYSIDDSSHLADVALIVRDDFQNKGVGQVLLSYLIHLANKEGLRGFTADVLVDNKPMLHLFEKMGFDIIKQCSSGVYELKLLFRANKGKEDKGEMVNPKAP